MEKFRTILPALVAALVLLGSGCGGSTDTTSANPESERESEGLPPNFDRPFVDGLRLPNIEAARQRLPFAPVFPSAAGQVVGVDIHADLTDEADQALGIVIQSPRYGRYMVIEDMTRATQQQLEGLADCKPDDGCQGTWQVVALASGIRALYIGGPTVHSIIWLRNGHRFNILGPAETFSRSNVFDVANAFDAEGERIVGS
jgi:hypothetical protein